MKIRAFLTLVILTGFVFTTSAQNYQTSAGLRGGFAKGLTFKHFIADDVAIEALAETRWRGLLLTGLMQRHRPALDIQGLRWYYGGGAHIGFWAYHRYNPWWTGDEDQNYVVLGLDVIIGIEYKLPDLPLVVSADWKPAFNFVGVEGFWGDFGALSLRYIFR